MKLRQTPISKITKPRLPKIFKRTRLLHLLDRSRRTPVTWITGPPGAGKTTLVASYLDSRKLPFIWYQIDEEDADIATFFYFMGQAAKKAAPRTKWSLPLLTPEYQFGIPAFTRRYFDDLFSRLKRPFVLVLDNYQEAPENSAFHETIMNGLSALPEGVTAILISRADPPPAFARMEANKIMNVIGWEQLQLTPEETSGVLRLHSGRPLQKESLRQIYEKTRGWAAGVVLMEASLRRSSGQIELEAMVPGKVSDYFAGEIFDKIDEEMQDFLLKTAYLPRMTPHMAEAITGNSRAGRILMDLNCRNSFTERSAEREPVYQYHAMFREFLRKRAEQEYTEAARSQLKTTAARLLEESGQIEVAVELLLDMRAWDKISDVILNTALSLVKQGRNRTLEGWLAAMPQETIHANPWLLYWKGTCLFSSDIVASQAAFEQSFRIFMERNDARATLMAWCGAVETIMHEVGDLKQLDHWIALLDKLKLRCPESIFSDMEDQIAPRMVMALTLRQPQHPELGKWIKKSLALVDKKIDPSLQILNQVYLFISHIFTGNLAVAGRLIEMLKLMSAPGASPLAQITARLAQAWYSWQTGRHQDCLRHVQEGLEYSTQTGMHLWDYLLMIQGVVSSLSSQDMVSAERLLSRIASVLDGARPLDKFYYYHGRALQYILQKEFHMALSNQEKALALASEVSMISSLAQAHFGMSQICHELGQHGPARKHLNEAWAFGTQLKSGIIEFMCLLAEADYAFDRGERQKGADFLARGLKLGAVHRYLNFNWWRHDVMARLCARALEAGIEIPYVREVIRIRNLVPDEPPLHIERWPWPIRIFTLGKFDIRKDNKPLSVSKKVQKKPLQLLKALIALGGQDVRENLLADLLWPDAEGDAAYKSLEVNIIRLRRLLGTADAVTVKEGRVTLDPRLCWVDVRAFEKAVESVDCRMPSETIGERETKVGKRKTEPDIAMLEKVLDLYKGPFLTEDPEPWSVSLREKLRDKFLRSIDALGAHLEQARKYKEALRVYQRGIDVDDLAELYYQRMMSCYVRLGRHAEALAVYNRCKKTFIACGVEPSEETEALRNSLRRQK